MLDHDVQRLAFRILKALDTPRSQYVSMLIDAGEWDQLTELRVNPAHYEPLYHFGVDRYRRDVLATEFLRKHDDLDTTFDKEERARRSFEETERQCARTNLYLDRFGDNPVLETALDEEVFNRLGHAKAWISRTLGELPTNLDGRFGPGATFESAQWRSASRKGITAITKLRKVPMHTPGVPQMLVDHLVWETAFGQAWEVCCPNRLFPTTRGSRFTVVNKDSTKGRGITIGAGVNLIGQLAVGGEMKLRLKRRGLDLQHGQALHRWMAEEASLTGASATIDLSNASNTVSWRLVKLLLPELWYDLLSVLREPFVLFSPTGEAKDNRWYRLEMFSSMGNGFTFELETLLFASLIHACGGRIGVDSFVYGDDMIVPTEIVPDVLALLQMCGFTPNEKKTFTQGSFRESCGGDYLNGHDVRPFYIEENPNESTDWMGIANSLWSWSLKWDLPELLGARASCLDLIPAAIRKCRGPESLGNLVLWDHPQKWSVRIRNSRRWFKVWRPVFRKRGFAQHDRIEIFESVQYVRSSGFTHEIGTRRDICRSIKEAGVAVAAAILGYPSDGLTPRHDLGVTGYRFGRISYS